MTRRYLPAGESALVVEFGRAIDPAAHAEVLALDAALATHPIDGVLEAVPTYRSLMVHFDPRRLTMAQLTAALAALAAAEGAPPAGRRWRIPACYEPPHGEDLVEAAGLLGLTPERVAALHAEADYTVVMYGFAPGYVFLGGLAPELAVSRRPTPRAPTPPGALTIAGGQTLIGSVPMPTGWYVLGRTPARTFAPEREPAFPLAVGDHVTFERVDTARFVALEAAADAGEPVLREAS